MKKYSSEMHQFESADPVGTYIEYEYFFKEICGRVERRFFLQYEKGLYLGNLVIVTICKEIMLLV